MESSRERLKLFIPYIPESDRERAAEHPRTPGELNYAITLRLISAWVLRGSPLGLSVMSGGVRRLIYEYWNEKIQGYTTINDIYGAIGCAILEFRRRLRPKAFGFEGMARLGIMRALSKVVDEFYIDVAAPYENEKKDENGDVY